MLNATARGKVYNLKNVADFARNYAALAVGMTVGGGAGSKTMKNDKGVIILHVRSEKRMVLTGFRVAAEVFRAKIRFQHAVWMQ